METGQQVYVSWNPAHAAVIGGCAPAEKEDSRTVCGEAEAKA